MKLEDLLKVVQDEPLFESSLLLAGDQDPGDLYRQVSRWVGAGKLIQLRRGLYALAPSLARNRPHPFLIANELERGTYVSLQSALSFHGMIPESVPTTTSVGAVRPGVFDTAFGRFQFHHLRKDLCRGYRRLEVATGQFARIALPEKALVDLLYLVPGSDDPNALAELRLSRLAELDWGVLEELVSATGKPKVLRALVHLERLRDDEQQWVAV